MENECYMDDMLSDGHSLQEALVKQSELIKLLMVGGFKLRKWLANDRILLVWLPSEVISDKLESSFDSHPTYAGFIMAKPHRPIHFQFEL